MLPSGFCIYPACGHSYREHMHIYYETEETTKQVEDVATKALLNSNLSAKEMKEAIIQTRKNLIDEIKSESQEIHQASVKFACFLKRNSITPYNDAMLDYMNHLIKEEEDKVKLGGNATARDVMIVTRDEYTEEIKILERNMELSGSDAAVLSPTQVQDAVKKLFSLKHYGEALKSALEAVKQTQRRGASYQEISGNTKSTKRGKGKQRLVQSNSRIPAFLKGLGL